jgi:hypothetical protein
LEEQQRNILIKQAIDKMNEADQAKKTSAEYKEWLKLHPQVIGQKQDSNASNNKVETKTYENKTNGKQTIKKSAKNGLVLTVKVATSVFDPPVFHVRSR